jgi:glycosyltransferase involved in cell wall biosynthesis
MRVALLSYNAQARNAVGNHVAETLAFFLDRGAEARVFVQSDDHLHPDVAAHCEVVPAAGGGPVWEFLAACDLVVAQYAQWYELLHFLPLLAGGKPRVLLDYHGITPPSLWHGPRRDELELSLRRRGIVWCVDQVIAHSQFTRQELLDATGFPARRLHRLELVVGDRFRPGPRSRWLHDRLSLGDARILLYVGRLASNKRVSLLVAALAQLPPDVHAAAVGDTADWYGQEAERCRSLARDLGVGGRFHLVGQLDDAELSLAYRGGEALVIPSLHEGFCRPVVEAMASGLPVVASRGTALPETVGDAGLTFEPDDASDLAAQVRRVLLPSPLRGRGETETVPFPLPRRGEGGRRIAIVAFRFGDEIVGGAETSLRTIGNALRSAGHHVEVFTTCTRSEGDWKNELPAGTSVCDGLTVHRFPIDPHDRERHLAAVRRIIEADGRMGPDAEQDYLRHSIHSTALIDALRRRDDFDAIMTGPYLFGLTHDVAEQFPGRTLLLPCFHDEPLARLRVWSLVYSRVGGVLLHSPEEQKLMQARLGVNHPNAVEIGTLLALGDPAAPATVTPRPYVVYCGRYSRQKNLPLLLDWFERYQAEHPGRLDLVCLGRGETRLPDFPWLHDLGRVDEARKRAVLAGARALVQLSTQESLSLVALEAWAQRTPVVVHRDCAVLAGQVERSGGGVAVTDYESFARALDGLVADPDAWRQRGDAGHGYVQTRYADRDRYVARLVEAIDNLSVPLAELMRRRGIDRAARCSRGAWRERFGQIIENLLHAPPRPYRPALDVEPIQPHVAAAPDARRLLVSVRLHNRGTHAAVADGPARTRLTCRVGDRVEHTDFPDLLMPGRSATVLVNVPVPSIPGEFRVSISASRADRAEKLGAGATLTLNVGGTHRTSPLAPLLDEARQAIARAGSLQKLPDDYVDVTEGRFARWKRWAKQKLLNNFKRAYVDVLSRQQSQVNQRLVLAAQQLAECCTTLEQAVLRLQGRVHDLEDKSACAVATRDAVSEDERRKESV